MKQLTAHEFATRHIAVLKAMRIYVPHITNNITTAFEIYQRILAEEQSERFIGTSMNVKNIPVFPCPECDTSMLMLGNAVDPDGERWPTAFRCPVCEAMFYSNLSVEECIKKGMDNG